ncbi:MAG: GNAT family N-acetyltransferase [Clostridia bacterium]|nr:GNAT family N-acetyltransferase [Clostridia bacterium]
MMDLYFNPNYAKLYENISGKSETFTFECEYGKMVNTFILRPVKWKIGGEQYYDIVTPYGFGGPLIVESTDTSKLMDAYRQAFTAYCLEHRIVCEFVRFHLFDNVDVREHFYGETVHSLDNVVVNTSKPYDEIRMHYKHKVRKNVNKANSYGLTLVVENNTDHLDDFLAIYYQTMDRNQAADYYYFKREYFENVTKLLPENFMFFYVYNGDRAIAAELVLCSDKYAYSFLGGTDSEFYMMRPNDMLKDGIIRWCIDTNREKFVLGGGYRIDDGIYRYKKSFTDDPDVPFYVGKAIYDKDAYNAIVEARLAADKDFDAAVAAYFPIYRA